MKIVHIIAGLHGGGRERRLVQLAKGLSADSRVEQFILLLTPKKECSVDYPEVYEYAHIIHMGSSSRMVLLKALCHNLVEIKPDIVHDWTGVPLVLGELSILKYRLGFKYVEGFVADGNPLTTISGRAMTKIAFAVSDAVVSNSMAGLLAKHAPLSKSHVFYNGFDFGRLEGITERDIEALRKEQGIPDGVKLISMLARHDPAKDWNTFLDVAQAMDKRDDVIFLSVGKGSGLENFKKSILHRGLRNVKALGFRHDSECIFAASYITLLFSNEKVHAEGVSNSIMESMAAGIPVIASAGGGTAEIIDSGEDGYIVGPKDVAAIVSRIERLLFDTDEYYRLGTNARLKIKSKFSLTRMVQEYQDLYSLLISAK